MAISAPSNAPQSDSPPLAHPPCLLILEDSSDYALLAGEMLREALDVRHHARLADARDDLACGEVDCVLLDLSLPDSIGLESLAKVREIAPDVPVVVLSGQESEELAVQAVYEGAQDYLVKRNADAVLLARSIRYAIQRKQDELELARQAYHDQLTGLPNRKLLHDRLGIALAAAERSQRLLAVLFLDLDRFKIVNDSLGHDVGDALLKAVSKRLSTLIRPSDTVARFGGDEFMILCPDLSAEKEAIVIAERLSGGLAEPLDVEGRELYVGVSIGIAFGNTRRATPESLIRDADRTMYRAKERGTRYELFEPGVGERAQRWLSLETELRGALDRHELRLYYQPELDCAENRIFGVEALLRWVHPERGMLAPGDFIPAAEDSGLIVPIGEWVIEEATRQLADWRRAGVCAPDLTMSVNVSPRQLGDRRLPGVVQAALAANDVPAEALCLELTESVVATDPRRMLRRLEELKALGVSLSLDDFGTGISSLSVLSGYPVDMLKVDRSFVTRLSDGIKQKRLFASVIGVAHALGLRAVAEGVETREQLEEVVGSGCDAVQGFFVCRPAAASELGASLRGPPAHALV